MEIGELSLSGKEPQLLEDRGAGVSVTRQIKLIQAQSLGSLEFHYQRLESGGQV